MTAPPRYCGEVDFPDKPYLPGVGPHPSSIDEAKRKIEVWCGSESTLIANHEFRWGVDLYNHHFYWEAHEVWEGLWKDKDKHSLACKFLQGLIQCAGAALKSSLGQQRGCLRLSEKALAKLGPIASSQLGRSIDLQGFVHAFQRFVDAASPTQTSAPLIWIAEANH